MSELTQPVQFTRVVAKGLDFINLNRYKDPYGNSDSTDVIEDKIMLYP